MGKGTRAIRNSDRHRLGNRVRFPTMRHCRRLGTVRLVIRAHDRSPVRTITIAIPRLISNHGINFRLRINTTKAQNLESRHVDADG